MLQASKLRRTIIYSFLISLVLATSFANSSDIYNGVISAKQIWFYGSMGLLLLGICINILTLKIKFSYTLNQIDLALLAFYAYFLIRAITTPYTPLIKNQKFLNWSLLLMFYFIVKALLCPINNYSFPDEENKNITQYYHNNNKINNQIIFITIHFLICSGLFEAVLGLLQLFGFINSSNSYFKITGTFFNPAPYSLYLASIFPIALGVFLFNNDIEFEGVNTEEIKIKRFSYYVSLLTVFSIFIILPATMNRASWIGVGAGSLVILNHQFQFNNLLNKHLRNKTSKFYSIFIITVFIIITGYALFVMKERSSNGRLLIWQITAKKISDKPLFGYGVARFEAEYNNWQANFFETRHKEMDGQEGMIAGNTKYCFNEFLELTSEIGVIGSILFIVVIFLVFSETHSLKNKNLKANKIIKSSLFAIIICALVSIPFYTLPVFIIFFFLIGLVSVQTEESCSFKRVNLKFSQLRTRIMTLMFLLPISLILIIVAFRQNKSYHTWKDATLLYYSSNYTEACKSYSAIQNSFRFSGTFLQYYGKALFMHKEYQKSAEILEQAKNYTCDELLFTTLGDTYKSLARFSEAEKTYLHAIHMAPNKLYPLFLLANLYFDTGQNTKFLETAHTILLKEIKVQSPASEEIIQKTRELIKKIESTTVKK